MAHTICTEEEVHPNPRHLVLPVGEVCRHRGLGSATQGRGRNPPNLLGLLFYSATETKRQETDLGRRKVVRGVFLSTHENKLKGIWY